jgi:hypothetical protein
MKTQVIVLNFHDDAHGLWLGWSMGGFFMDIGLGFGFFLGSFGILIRWVESNQENIENRNP